MAVTKKAFKRTKIKKMSQEYTNTARTTADSSKEGRLKVDAVGGKAKKKKKHYLMSEIKKYYAK